MTTLRNFHVRDRLRQAPLDALLLLGALGLMLPLAYMVVSSLKPLEEVFGLPPSWVPSRLEWSNFVEPFYDRPFWRYILNSGIVALCVTLLNLAVSTLTGYSLSKFRYPGRELVFLVILSTIMLPIQVIMVPMYLLVKSLGWLNSYQALIVPQAVTAFGVFLMRQHIQSVPNELLDAARADGCGEVGIFLRVIVPISKPALMVLAVFVAIANWESFLWPLIVISSDNLRTVPVGLAMFAQEFYTVYNQLFATTLIAMAPVTIVFVLLQRLIVSSVVLSGLKG